MYWLRSKDSNLDRKIQSLPCYHYTTPQKLNRAECSNGI